METLIIYDPRYTINVFISLRCAEHFQNLYTINLIGWTWLKFRYFEIPNIVSHISILHSDLNIFAQNIFNEIKMSTSLLASVLGADELFLIFNFVFRRRTGFWAEISNVRYILHFFLSFVLSISPSVVQLRGLIVTKYMLNFMTCWWLTKLKKKRNAASLPENVLNYVDILVTEHSEILMTPLALTGIMSVFE